MIVVYANFGRRSRWFFDDSGTASQRSAPSLRRLRRVRRVARGPRPSPRGPVDRGDVLPRQPQPRLHLGPVVAGVQLPPPEHPNPLPLQTAEEGALLQPPRG